MYGYPCHELASVKTIHAMSSLASKLGKAFSGGYPSHDTPVHSPGDHSSASSLVPSHYAIPNERGYFPAPSSSSSSSELVAVSPCTLYQIHPRYGGEKLERPVASGPLSLREPDAGTDASVVLIGICDGIAFYITSDDATARTSDTEMLLMLPRDCLVLDLAGAGHTDVLRVEGLLAARTKFHDQREGQKSTRYPEALPDDAVSRAMFRTSQAMARMLVSGSRMASKSIDKYGEKKKEAIKMEDRKEMKVGSTSIKASKVTRTVSKKTHTAAVLVSDKISDVMAKKLVEAVTVKKGDTESQRKARTLLLASTLAYGEISSGAAEGYETMVRAAKDQAVAFVATKYGKDAGQLARNTAGATANFGRAALTARRIVDVKKVAKVAGKQAVKQSIKNVVAPKG